MLRRGDLLEPNEGIDPAHDSRPRPDNNGDLVSAGQIRVEPTDPSRIESMRRHHERAARCQIVRYSILPRGLADAWCILINGEPAGYGAVWNRHFPGRLMEFHVEPEHRTRSPALFRALAETTGAVAVEAQTNMPMALAMLHEFADEPAAENLLFDADEATRLELTGAAVRRRRDGDDAPDGDWVVELSGRAVAGGGFLTHYNAPWADLYYEVAPAARGRGVGGYFVQELRRLCEDAGHRPAARCDPGNEASRRTLLRGGMKPCGRLLAGALTAAGRDRASHAEPAR
jgi:RimJ/RimL family protein N-acetyltransferase